jgi:hypothetical protein
MCFSFGKSRVSVIAVRQPRAAGSNTPQADPDRQATLPQLGTARGEGVLIATVPAQENARREFCWYAHLGAARCDLRLTFFENPIGLLHGGRHVASLS